MCDLKEYTCNEAITELEAAIAESGIGIETRVTDIGPFGSSKSTSQPVRRIVYAYALTLREKTILTGEYRCPDIHKANWKIRDWNGERIAVVKREHLTAEILGCLLMDASGVDQAFEDWASDCGFDPDSRSAYNMYLTCQKERHALIKVFGVEEVERLSSVANQM